MILVVPESLTVHAFRPVVSLQHVWWTSWANGNFLGLIVATFELSVVLPDLESSNSS